MLVEQRHAPGAAIVNRPTGHREAVPARRQYAAIKAILFDLDGTLYDQKRLRRAMALELAAYAIRRPFEAPQTVRVVAEFRKAQEALRGRHSCQPDDQVRLAAAQARTPVARVEAIVDEWMFERPLKHLRGLRAEGLLELLAFCDRRALKTGVFSDYAAADKLTALGIGDRFSQVLCSTDEEIGAFKPDPRGFLVAASRWGLDPSHVLVVGDRPDVDAAGACAAGMPCIIVNGRQETSVNFAWYPSFERVRDVLDNDYRR